MNGYKQMAITGVCVAMLLLPVAAHAGAYENGVAAYERGDYAQAARVFEKCSRKSPDNARVAYFLAIACAQLGRIAEARQAYEAVLRLAPDTPEAALAQEGLRYLPALALQMAGEVAHPVSSAPTAQAASVPQQPTEPPAAPAAINTGSAPAPDGPPQPSAAANAALPAATGGGTPTATWTPQETMAMQMLMGSMTPNNGTTGFQPWMMPGMNAATPGTAQTPAAFDPAAFNAMMMSQMMGSMDMMGGANNPNSDR